MLYCLDMSNATAEVQNRSDARREQLLHELASDLSALVGLGEITADAANEWYARKADQWSTDSR